MELLSTIQNYWAIIVFCGTIIASWVRYESKITANKSAISELNNRLNKTDNNVKLIENSHNEFRNQMQGIRVDIAEIKTTTGFIREALADIKNHHG